MTPFQSDSCANLRLSSRVDLECKWVMGTVGDSLGVWVFLVRFDGKYHEPQNLLDISLLLTTSSLLSN